MTPDIETLGKYQLLEELGRGGFATVYRALNTTLDREEALKVLHPQLLVDPGFVARFLREARAIANLRHAHIVTVYEVGNADGRLFISMELAHGSDLGGAIAERARIPWAEALSLLRPVCEALDYAHAQKIVHRDLKPSNILLDPARGPLLSDFGFARLMGGSSQSLSLSGGILGTPAYIAPEVWELDAATPAADIYALGCIAFEMLTGQVLFTGATPIQAMRAHDRGPVLPQAWPEGVPVGVAEVLGKALAREPGARYPSATALWHALNDLEARAQAEREASERAAVAGQWRAEAESALAAGELSAARMAAGRWMAAAPEDGEAKAFLERVREAVGAGPREARGDAEVAEGDGQRAGQETGPEQGEAGPGLREGRKDAEGAEGDGQRAGQETGPEQGAVGAGPREARGDAEVTELDGQRAGQETGPEQAEAGPGPRKAWNNAEVAEEDGQRAGQETGPEQGRRRKIPAWVWALGGVLLVAAVVLAVVVASGRAKADREESAQATAQLATAQFRLAATQRAATAQAQETAWAQRIGATQSAATSEAEASRRAATAQANTARQTETAVVQAEATAQGATSTAQAEATRQKAMLTAQAQAENRQATSTARTITPGGCGRLLFVDWTDEIPRVATIDADGSNLVHLAPGGEQGGAVWSPDGTRIAFGAGATGHRRIYVMNADGSTQSPLTDEADGYPDFAWSPDGKHIAYSFEGDIFVVNISGAEKVNVTRDRRGAGELSWSPDGTRLLFVSERDGDWEIYAIGVDGEGLARLTSSKGGDFGPAWSPDGRWIVFESTRDNDDEIYLMGADGSGVKRLTTTAGYDNMPGWSPDGGQIAFISNRGGTGYEIYVMNADGTGVTRLTTNRALDEGAAWSPDGKRIAYTSTQNRTTDLNVINADGSGLQRLLILPDSGFQVSWQPQAWQGRTP